MNQRTKIILALSQVEGIIKLMKDNEYEAFFTSHLSPVIYELQRQLTNQTNSTKIKE